MYSYRSRRTRRIRGSGYSITRALFAPRRRQFGVAPARVRTLPPSVRNRIAAYLRAPQRSNRFGRY